MAKSLERSALQTNSKNWTARVERRLDRLWKVRVAKDSGGRCQRCGEPDCLPIHAAHIIPRWKRSTRWDPRNGIGLGPKCHKWAHQEPKKFIVWVINGMLGAGFALLKMKSEQIFRPSPEVYDRIEEELKA